MKTLKYFLLCLELILIVNYSTFAQSQQNWMIYDTTNSIIPSNSIHDIVIDDLNRKWISFWGDGLIHIDENYWTLYNTDNSSIPSNIIASITIDKDLNLWAGGYIDDFRLAKFDGSSWTVWTATNSPIPEKNVRSLTVDSQNSIWFLSTNETNFTPYYLLELTEDSTWIIHPSIESFGYQRQMVFDDDQVLWIGNWHGLYKYDGDTLSFIDGGSLGQYVTDVKIDTSDNIWMATGAAGWGGLVKYDGTIFIEYNILAFAIEFDEYNNLWVGTEGSTDYSSLFKYDGTNWTEFSSINSELPQTYRITDLAFDNFGNLWIGTLDAGLIVFNENGIVIPVELTSFTASAAGNDVHLNWSTATELNNYGFNIEKRQTSDVKQNRSWKEISFVPGHGTTTEQQQYSFIDESVPSGKYQYRLKQIDYDGTFEYSDIVEVEVGLSTEFSLSQNYPNPFNPSTKIQYAIGSPQFVSLKVYDVLGNEVATLVNEEKPAGNYEVDFYAAGLPSGIYFYQLRAGKFIQSKKMILIK